MLIVENSCCKASLCLLRFKVVLTKKNHYFIYNAASTVGLREVKSIFESENQLDSDDH